MIPPIKLNVGQRKAQLSRGVKRFWTPTSSGTSSEVAGTRTAELELLIDVERLVGWLRNRAMLSKGRRARAISGTVVLRTIKTTEKDVIVPHVHTQSCYKDGVIACEA